MICLSDAIEFPSVDQADEDGLLAIGGDLSTDRLILAYRKGIFPWYDPSSPILWWSPNPRMVLFRDELRISKSMQKIIQKQIFRVTYDTCFEQIITNCAKIKRVGQEGTWIDNQIIEAYTKLYQMGIAHCVEVWQENLLVGGLYGIRLGKVFCGESMFSLVSNASKYGFISFVQNFKEIELIDCQVYSEHLASLGAREIPRDDFISMLEKYSKIKNNE